MDKNVRVLKSRFFWLVQFQTNELGRCTPHRHRAGFKKEKKDMQFMFSHASAFYQPLGGWRVAEVTSMNGMFWGASSFNQPLGDWWVEKVTDMGYMFMGASSFNAPYRYRYGALALGHRPE